MDMIPKADTSADIIGDTGVVDEPMEEEEIDTSNIDVNTNITKEIDNLAKNVETKKLQSQKGKTIAESKEISNDMINDFMTQFEENGELDEKSYQALAKKGLPRELVDRLIKAEVAVRQAEDKTFDDTVKAIFGGEEKQKEIFNKIAQLDAKILPNEERQALNNMLTSKDISLATIAGKYIKQLAGRTVQGQAGAGTQSPAKTFKSMEEYLLATRSDKYKTDVDYKKEIDNRFINFKKGVR